ncbi:PDZ domain-containing protein [soil metagenome]
MHFQISYINPHRHLIDITLTLEDIKEQHVELQLPAWRPGRYEIANYSKNIKYLKAHNENNESLPVKKISKDRWKIYSSGPGKIKVYYSYYAFQMDAGNSYLDESQLYINFINCLLYVENKMLKECVVELDLPDDYKIACGLTQSGKNLFLAPDYYRLVDSPLIASNKLRKFDYTVNEFIFHIWIMGEVKANWDQVRNDFYKFSLNQIQMMEGFPCPDYHFLFQILPSKHYHGVEHFNSTVITIGPSEKFTSTDFYNNFLGISSHELFHTWNVIRIRPQEMTPYDFSKENYFNTGFVAEGFTTYYGDLFLVRSGVYDKKTYLGELNNIIFRHIENNGRFNLSLTESSFDLWLDGYVAGIPNRKVSIYVKGALIALMLDLEIRAETQNKKTLDDVIKYLWQEFGQKSKGYSLEDVKKVIENISQKSFDNFFQLYISGTEPEEKKLQDLLKFVGCQLRLVENLSYESIFGFKVSVSEGITKVTAIEPGSIAESQLSLDDELVALNDRKIENNLADLVGYKESVELTIFRNKNLKRISLVNIGQNYWKNYKIIQNQNASAQEKENFEDWLGCAW